MLNNWLNNPKEINYFILIYMGIQKEKEYLLMDVVKKQIHLNVNNFHIYFIKNWIFLIIIFVIFQLRKIYSEQLELIYGKN
jgi:hypothetical protein